MVFFSKITLGVWVLIFLLTPVAQFAQEPPRLFFKKKISVEEKELIKKYTVRRGDHLFQILRQHGIQETDLPAAVKTTARLNPTVTNLDRLHPGQELLIPLTPDIDLDKEGKVSLAYTRDTQKKEADPPPQEDGEQASYVVQEGDTVLNILRNMGFGDREIYRTYLPLLSQMNPEVGNLNIIEVGQTLTIPVPPGTPVPPPMTVGRKAADKKTEVAKTAQPPSPDTAVTGPSTEVGEVNGTAIPDRVGKTLESLPEPPKKRATTRSERRAFVITLLKTLNFRFTPGQELLYPIDQDRWLKVNLKETPLTRAPWGTQMALLPPDHQDQEQEFRDILYRPVHVPAAWDVRGVLKAMEKHSDDRIKLWPGNVPLILHKGGLTLELNASYLVRLNREKRFYLMNTFDPGETPVPALLTSFFSRKGIYIHEWLNQQSGPPRPVQQPLASQDNLMVPWIDRYNAWPELKLRLSPRARAVEPRSRELRSVLDVLRERDMLSTDPIRLSWFPGTERELSLVIPATTIYDGSNKLALLEWNIASPHVVALLSLKGYGCLAVK